MNSQQYNHQFSHQYSQPYNQPYLHHYNQQYNQQFWNYYNACNQYQNTYPAQYQHSSYYQQALQYYNQPYQYAQNYYQNQNQQIVNQAASQQNNYMQPNQTQQYLEQTKSSQHKQQLKKLPTIFSSKSSLKLQFIAIQNRSIQYQPGQQTNTICRQISRDVGHPNWKNPYKIKNIQLDERVIYEYQTYISQKQKSKKKKQVSQSINSSFEKAFEDDQKKDSTPKQPDLAFKKRKDKDQQREAKKSKKRKYADKAQIQAERMPAQNKKYCPATTATITDCLPVETETISTICCPFDSSHIMQPKRLLTHISRCKLICQNALQYKMCPYDPTHYYRYDLIEEHTRSCDKRELYEDEYNWDQLYNGSQVKHDTLANQCDRSKQTAFEDISASQINHTQNNFSHQINIQGIQSQTLENLLTADF